MVLQSTPPCTLESLVSAVSNINMRPLYITILILGLSCRVYTENSCPHHEDIFPCDCNTIESRKFDVFEDYDTELTVSCKFNKKTGGFETLQKGIRSLSGKKDVSLTLKGYNISMPTKLFSGIDIKQLIFENCYMHSSTNNDHPWFLGLENNLQELIIDNSLILPENFNIGKLGKLKSFIIRRNDIPELGDGIFTNELCGLEELAIFKNNIVKIGRNVFSKLNNLKRLTLENEHFGQIKRSMLPMKPDRLTTLRLDYNGLIDLPEDLFTGMPSLQSLSIKYNEITTLDERTWSPIWQQLRSIHIYGNNLICDERLNWIHKANKSKKWPTILFAKCSGPEEWKDKFLPEYLET